MSHDSHVVCMSVTIFRIHPSRSIYDSMSMCVCTCTCVCSCACVHLHVHTCTRMGVHAGVCVYMPVNITIQKYLKITGYRSGCGRHGNEQFDNYRVEAHIYYHQSAVARRLGYQYE